MFPQFGNLISSPSSFFRSASSVSPASRQVMFGGSSPTIEEDQFVRSGETDKAPESPELDTPKQVDITPVDDPEDHDLENDEKDWAKQLSENSKPLSIQAEPTLPVIQQLRSASSDLLRQILSRPHLNNAILTYDDARLRDAILAQLQSESGNVVAIDCKDIEPKKNGSFFSKKETEYQLAKALQQALPAIQEKSGQTGNPPLTVVLNNVHQDELSNLQKNETCRKIQNQFPNVRFIVPQSLSEESEDSKSFSWKDDDDDGPSKWRAGQFQVINIPSLKPQEWAKVLQKDPFVQQVLNFYNLSASETVLGEFFEVLKREDQTKALSYDDLVAELSSLGSFINKEFAGDDTLTNQHIKTYTRKVLATRRVHTPTAGGPANTGPAPYDLINAGDINVKMDDIVGHEEPKKILTQALKEAKYPELFAYLNEGDPDASQNNVLLMGAPGGGKTMLAKAIAAQGGATFISTSGSRFVTGLVGGGANGIRRLRDAIEEAPDDLVVVFIDEMDALGSRSGMGGEMGASGSEDLKTINEFLAFTDGVKRSHKRILLIGATNRPEALDPAIRSRFNYKLEISELNQKQRLELIKKQLKQKNLHPDDSVDLKSLARQAKDFSGRDIKNWLKNVKDKLIRNIDAEELERLEQDEEARKAFKLQPTHKDMIEGIREIKKSKRQIEENEKSGEYSGSDKE